MLPIDSSAINVPSSSLATFNSIQRLFRVFGGLERLQFHLSVRVNTAPIANEHDLTKQCRLQTEFVKPPHVAAVINATQNCSQLMPMIDAVEPIWEGRPEQLSADSGYCSEPNLARWKAGISDGGRAQDAV